MILFNILMGVIAMSTALVLTAITLIIALPIAIYIAQQIVKILNK